VPPLFKVLHGPHPAPVLVLRPARSTAPRRARHRSDRSDAHGHAPTQWARDGTHNDSRFVSAESEIGRLPVSVLFSR
jgi:hypothetical protein